MTEKKKESNEMKEEMETEQKETSPKQENMWDTIMFGRRNVEKEILESDENDEGKEEKRGFSWI